MDIFIGLLALISMVGVCWGFIKLFRKGHRKRGMLYLMGSLAVGVVGATLGGIEQDKDARAAGYVNYSAQQEAERLSAVVAGQEERERKAVERAALAATEQAERKLEIEEERRKAEARTAWQERKRVASEATETARQATEAERQSRKATKTTMMANSVIEVMRARYQMEPVTNNANGQPCREDGYCDFRMGTFRVEIYGAGIATVETTNQVSHSTYREVCSAVFSAISGSDLDYSAELIEQAFRQASEQGRVKADMHGVQIDIKPDLSNIYACGFFKY